MASRLTIAKDRQAEIAAAQTANAARLEDATLTADARKAIVTDSKALEVEFKDLGDEIAALEAAAAKTKRELAAGGARHIEVRDQIENDPKRGFKSIVDFSRSVKAAFSPNNGLDERLKAMGGLQRVAAPSNYMQEESGSSGEGFLVPPQFRQDIYEIIFAQEGILSVINPEPTDSNAIEFNADETTPWGSTGVVAAWRSEAAQLTANKAVTKTRVNKLWELYALVIAENELLDDAPRLADHLTNKAGQAIAWKADDALVNGDGVGKPLGIAAAQNPSLVVQAKDSGQAASTVTVTNFGNMFSRLIRAGGGRPTWLIHPTVQPQILTLSIGNQPAYLPNNMPLAGGPSGGTLLGYPIIWSEHSAALTSQGDVILFNPTGYFGLVKSGGGLGMKADVSMHLFFDYNMSAFRWIFRLGGMPYLSAAVSRAKGSATISHCVALASR